MNNEELKKKIVDILNKIFTERDVIPVHTAPDGKKTALPDELCEIFNKIVVQAVIPYFADALIDANIFVDIDTLKDEQQSMNGILTNMNYKLHELEHRAEVAERALRIFAENCSCADCPFFGGCQIIPDVEDDFSCCFDMYLAIAEKDLAEEK